MRQKVPYPHTLIYQWSNRKKRHTDTKKVICSYDFPRPHPSGKTPTLEMICLNTFQPSFHRSPYRSCSEDLLLPLHVEEEKSRKDVLLDTPQTRLNRKLCWDLITFISRHSFPKILADFYILRENNNREKCNTRLILLQSMTKCKTTLRHSYILPQGEKVMYSDGSRGHTFISFSPDGSISVLSVAKLDWRDGLHRHCETPLCKSHLQF